MFNTAFEDILDRCLERIEAGESIESCLSDYPDHAEELKGSLEMDTHLQGLPVERPSLAADFFFQQQLEQVKPAAKPKPRWVADGYLHIPLKKIWGIGLEFGFVALLVALISFVFISHSDQVVHEPNGSHRLSRQPSRKRLEKKFER